MTHSDEHSIPTLTDIIQPGDESMKNHFDAHYFDAADSITSTEEQAQASDHLQDTVRQLIQEALDETLPAIEDQLREQLTRKVLDKLNDE